MLLLSHGQATVERGFSINRQLEVENLNDQSYEAQRIICDHVHYVGGLLNVNITKELLSSATGARHKYQAYLEDKKHDKVNMEKSQKRTAVEEEIKELITKNVD